MRRPCAACLFLGYARYRLVKAIGVKSAVPNPVTPHRESVNRVDMWADFGSPPYL